MWSNFVSKKNNKNTNVMVLWNHNPWLLSKCQDIFKVHVLYKKKQKKKIKIHLHHMYMYTETNKLLYRKK